MPTRTGLSIWCYTAPTNTNYSVQKIEIGSSVTALSFASAAPGGFTTFSATLPLKDTRIPLPPFQLFSIVAVMSGPKCIWLGEMTDPEIGFNETQGDYLRLSALGVGNALRDDPLTLTYTGQTVQAIAKDQLSRRTNGSPFNKFATISTDASYIFPDNPAGTYAPIYDNRTMEDVLGDVVALAGDYHWGVWAHPVLSQVDAAGFPLGLLKVHLRDTATTSWIATRAGRDIMKMSLTLSSERAYNYVSVDYTIPSTGGVGTKFALDSRLNGTSLAQQSAPFRYRKMTRDYTGTQTVTAAVAQSLASVNKALYSNVSNKITITLRSINDANGARIPLWEGAFADTNIFVPDLTTRGISAMPTVATAGTNQFYVVLATYTESATDSYLELQCDNFYDRAATQIARLTLAQDVKNRSTKTQGVVQAQGAAASGYVTIGQSNAVSGQISTGTMQWPVMLYQAPTGVSFTQIVRTNLNTPSFANANAFGAIAQATASASSTVQGAWTYTTSGNCLVAIGKHTFDWHCDHCDKLYKGLSIGEHLVTHVREENKPGHTGMAVACPECEGFSEAFNTGLTSADEMHDHHPRRAEQARLIRQLMRHGAVGLETHP